MTRVASARKARRQIEQAGLAAVAARYDMAGNCVYCGEAGRCPGWHATTRYALCGFCGVMHSAGAACTI